MLNKDLGLSILKGDVEDSIGDSEAVGVVEDVAHNLALSEGLVVDASLDLVLGVGESNKEVSS